MLIDLTILAVSDVGHLSHLILLAQWSRASEVQSPTRRVITYQEFTDRSVLDPIQRFAELEGLGDVSSTLDLPFPLKIAEYFRPFYSYSYRTKNSNDCRHTWGKCRRVPQPA